MTRIAAMLVTLSLLASFAQGKYLPAKHPLKGRYIVQLKENVVRPEQVEALVEKADQAMYEVKKARKAAGAAIR